MATATEPKPSSNKKIKLMGLAQTEHDTFMEQCIYFAGLYWPNWKNYQNPSSYMIPRVFNYFHPDVSDEAIRTADLEKIRRAERADYSTLDRHITDRTSDEAEHIVFTALQQLVEEKVQAPMIVVHNLNIHDNETLISKLFPGLATDPKLKEAFDKCKREYDFLIIGPHVGIAAIEVKSSRYTAKTAFKKDRRVPKTYNDGLRQLESVDALFLVLNACAEIDSPSLLPIRKFMFTPNLNKNRYDTWMNSMDKEARQKVESLTNTVIQWFTGDMDNSAAHSNKPPLYSALRNILETGTDLLPREITEKYSLLVSGFRSMICLGENFQLNTTHLSQNEAISLEHCRIDEQNPFEGQKNSKVSEHSLLNRVDLSKLNYDSKLLFLSPDQQAAFDGPPVQFIIGVAGTGKTVILQAKALQLLSDGEKVVVFAPENSMLEYGKLFDSYGFDPNNYLCHVWPSAIFIPLRRYFDKYIEKAAQNGTYCTKEIMRHICEYVKEEAVTETLVWLTGRNLLIDDTCDETRSSSIGHYEMNSVTNPFVAWTLMAYLCAVCPTKITWAALDPTTFHFALNGVSTRQAYVFHTTMEGLLSADVEQGGAERFRASVLRQVMRCSESVFRIAYSPTHKFRWIKGTEPIMAHKIQGLTAAMAVCECGDSVTKEDAEYQFWELVEDTLLSLSRDGVDMTKAVVVVGEVPFRVYLRWFKIGSVKIPVYEYDDVSSMEWPIVVYASCFRKNYDFSDDCFEVVSYPRYRAVTRATTKLVEITVTYMVHSAERRQHSSLH